MQDAQREQLPLLVGHLRDRVAQLAPRERRPRGDKLSMFVVGGKATYEKYDANDSRIA